MKFIKLFEDIYPGFTSTLSSEKFEKEIEFTEEELIDIFEQCREIFEKNLDVIEIKNIFKNILGENVTGTVYKRFNIKPFIKSLEIQLKISTQDALEYFDEYIDSIPRRYRKVFYKDFGNYRKEDIEKVKKLKDETRNKESYKYLKKEKDALFKELVKLVIWVKENNKKVLISFDGRDTGGKGSMARFILTHFFATPLGRNIIYRDFGIPTRWQQRNWFHRYEKVLPEEGQLVIFDRSWYNRAVNDPVMGYASKTQYEKFMAEVNDFEKDLVENKDIVYIKFWLSIDKETQELRFNLRKQNPIKYWKFSENDLRASARWNEFSPYIERMFRETSTDISRWVVVNMDDKPLGLLNALRYILNRVPYPDKDEKILGVYPEIVYEITPGFLPTEKEKEK